MKKITAIIITAALFAALAGCNENNASEDSGSSSLNGTSNTESEGFAEPESSDADNSEPQTPAGEVAFLTAPDGTAIYTSEIAEMYKGSEEDGDKKEITLAEAEEIARSGGDFTVKCGGFTYAYFSERAVNRFDDPDLFEANDNGRFDYIGGGTNKGDSSKDVDSIDFIRMKPGDKFGALTVKDAYMLFGKNDFIEDGLSDVPGVYVKGSRIEFDGEVELEGFLNVAPMDTLYGMGGDMSFYPNGDSSVKIPSLSYYCDKGYLKPHYTMHACSEGWFGGNRLYLGNINEAECDVSGIKPGDEFVKVKVVLNNIRITKQDNDRILTEFDLESIETV